jgi:hypothetical protein
VIAPSLNFNTGGASAPPAASSTGGGGGILGGIVKIATGVLTGEYGYEQSKEAGISKVILGNVVYVYDHRTHDIRMYNANDPSIPTDAIDKTDEAKKRIYVYGGIALASVMLLAILRR